MIRNLLIFMLLVPVMANAAIPRQSVVANGEYVDGVLIAKSITKVALGYDCDLDASDVCIDNKITYTIGGPTADFDASVTVNFSTYVQLGKFADTRSYWVMPMAPSSSVQISSIGFTGNLIDAVFADSNPNVDAQGILPPREGHDYGNYDANETISLPASLSGKQTILLSARASLSRDCGVGAIEDNCSHFINTLTITDEIPPNYGRDVIRPALGTTTKTFDRIGIDFDLTKTPSDSRFAVPASLSDVLDRWTFSTEIFSIGTSTNGAEGCEGGRCWRSFKVGDYAASRARLWGTDVSSLMTDALTLEQKTPSLAALIAYGRDLFYATHTCTETVCTQVRPFLGGAGQGIGKGAIVALFALYSNDSKYRNAIIGMPARRGAGFPDDLSPVPSVYQALKQINNGPNGPVWGDFADSLTSGAGFEGFHFCMADMLARQNYAGAPNPPLGTGTGNRTTKDPWKYVDGACEQSGGGYAHVTAGFYRWMAVTMTVWPEFRSIINYDPIIEYARRFHYVGVQAANDPVAPPDPREDPDVCTPHITVIGQNNNCSHYGQGSSTPTSRVVTWGAVPSDATLQTPVLNGETWTHNGTEWVMNPAQPGDANFGQSGRFPHRHGVIVTPNPTYTIPAIESVFTSVITEN